MVVQILRKNIVEKYIDPRSLGFTTPTNSYKKLFGMRLHIK